jgi:hypothetical protein
MRKDDFAAGLFVRAQANPRAAIVGPRIGSGKIDSHAWREQFVADNRTAERPQPGATPGQDRAQKNGPDDRGHSGLFGTVRARSARLWRDDQTQQRETSPLRMVISA